MGIIIAIIVQRRHGQSPAVLTTTAAPTADPQTQQANRIAQTFQTALKIDQDLDGLSDEEEKKYGTSPASSDTDQDGLLDKDEVTIFKTDPLKTDTYGIGHLDGWSVQRGIILPDGKINQAQLNKFKK